MYNTIYYLMSKKAAIVTWIKYNNFGTFLQAYALQQVLLKLGIIPFILDDATIIEEGRLQKRSDLCRRFMAFCKKTIRSLIKRNQGIDYLRKESDIKYARFKKNFLRIDANIHPLLSLNDRYDVFISGSDQIWYPSLLIFSPYYYLSFADKKKIAYAPSIGTSEYPMEFVSKVKPLLERFDSLSVREKIGAGIISSIVNREVEAVLDPTLLLNGEEWSSLLLPEPVCTEKYALCYLLTYNEDYVQYVTEYAQRHSLTLVTFALINQSGNFADKIISAGPQEFLTAIYGAEYVFTDSFHCTIFSLHFKKRFCTFKRFADDDVNNQNSRITNLLGMVGLNKHFIDKEHLSRIESLPLVDYETVKAKLRPEIEKSIQYLTNALAD